MANQITKRDLKGLRTQPNRLTVPAGSLLLAQNVDPARQGVTSLRRGFEFYGAALPVLPEVAIQYLETLVIQGENAIYYDSAGDGSVWSQWPGTFAPPEAGARVVAAEAARNLYLATGQGVMKQAGLTGTPRRAGIPQGLDVGPELTGTGGPACFLPPDRMVGYRTLFQREDSNGYLEGGVPSMRETVANLAPADVTLAAAGAVVTVTHVAHGYLNGDTIEISAVSDPTFEAASHAITWIGVDSYSYTVAGAPPPAGTAKAGKRRNVTLDITLSHELVEGDILEIYRTEVSASEDTDPGDRHLLVETIYLSAAQIAAGTVTYLDDTDQAELGTDLEINTNRNGEGQASYRPPWCKFLIEWKGGLWFAYTRQPHALELRLEDVATLVDDVSSLTITCGADHNTYVFSAAEDFPNHKFKRWTTGSTASENIRRTARSLCRAINRDSAGLVNAFYTSGVRDAPGKILFRHRNLNTPSLSFTADSDPTGQAWAPDIPPATGAQAALSDADQKRNGVYNSREGRPECVPVENEWLPGSDNDAVTGLGALDDALVIFTEGGTWMITGENDGGAGDSFRMDKLDLSLVLRVPYSVARSDDALIGWFTQGACRVTSAGAAIISRGIEYPDLCRKAEYTYFRRITWGMVSQADHRYFLFTPKGPADSLCQEAWVYSTIENEWTGPWDIPASGGVVLRRDNRIYLVRNNMPAVIQERKSFLRSGRDHMDETWACTVTSFTTVTDPEGSGATVSQVVVTYTGSETLTMGWLWKQNHHTGEVIAVVDLGGNSYRLTLHKLTTPANGAAELVKPIDMLIKAIFDAGNAGVLKQATEAQLYFEDPQPRRVQLGFLADTQRAVTWLPVITVARPRGWGGPWGGPWGGNSRGSSRPVRTKIPMEHQRHRVLYLLMRHRSAGQMANMLQMTVDVRIISSVTTR